MKNIIAVATVITAVMAIVLIAFSSTVSAESVDRKYTADGGALWYKGTLKHDEDPDKAGNISEVYEGEMIRFLNYTSNKSFIMTVSGPCEWDGDHYDEYEEYTVLNDTGWDAEGKPTRGYFKAVNASGHGGWFKVRKHSITMELEGEKKKVQKGEDFRLRLKKNDRYEGVMKLTIEDDEGFSIEDGMDNDIYEALVRYKEKDFVNFSDADNKAVVTAESVIFNKTSHMLILSNKNKTIQGISIKDGNLVFNTSNTELDMKEGRYTIKLEDYATEADDDVDIEVEEIYLEVECDDEVVKGDDIVIIIRSSFYKKKANVTVKDSISEKNKSITLDEEGKKKVKFSTEDRDYGRHEITIEVCGRNETKYVTIKESETSLEIVSPKEKATVGDIVTIKGKSDFGDFAVFLVDDIFKKEARISGDKFEWDWDTSGELDGYREIEVFILSEQVSFSIGNHVSEDWQRGEGVDESATIFLFLPEFTMTVSKNIAKGDDVVISGTVIGADHVYVIVMNHKGEVKFPAGGIAKATAVEDEKWEENIGELDSGRYTVIALYEGRDGITDAINETDKKWVAGDESKTLEQRAAILLDAMSSAGSDDLFEKADFSVHAPKVILKEPKTVVEIGDAITVKAETNIKTGAKAFVSLSQDSNVLKKNFTLVENGSVNASIDTIGLQPGKYNVAVDISGRASDEKEVTLVEKKEVMEEGKEEIAQNESLTEPAPEAAKDANETVGEGKFLNETGGGWEEVQKKIPVHVCDLIIAVVVASAILGVARRRRGRR